uniref:Uncharacterized protein n=1 Tax=Myoviridae sp. ct2th6 TaxID=2826606 RepID=A0A8S5NPG8_9CAUD|nr:MAG TPA: hypothetical protein [Myoviridae sp. ct2th6]
MRRCPKVVFKSLVTPNPQSLTTHPYFHTSHLLRIPYIQNSVPLFLISNSREAFSVVKR